MYMVKVGIYASNVTFKNYLGSGILIILYVNEILYLQYCVLKF